MTAFSKPKEPSTRWKLVAVAGAVALVLGASAAAVVAMARSEPSAGESSPATPEPTTEPIAQFTPPDTVSVVAGFPSWVADPTATLAAEAGRSVDGEISLNLTAPQASAGVIYQVVDVTPSTEYSMSASFRAAEDADSGETVSIAVGESEPVSLGGKASAGEWHRTEWVYTTGPEQTEVGVNIQALGAVSGVRVDHLVMTAEGEETNLIANGSFEDYSAPTQITNDTLIMPTGGAYVGVAARVPDLHWLVKTAAGATHSSGEVTSANGLALVQLGALEQGMYSIELSSASAGLPLENFSFLVLDKTIPDTHDDRFGAMAHIMRPYYDGAEVLAEQLGITNIRVDAPWDSTENEQGIYTFPADRDVLYASYASHGIEMLPISAYLNKFYDDAKTPSSPEGIEAYSKYSSALVGHYGMPAVEIYNEFNHEPFNSSACGRTAECYMQLLSAAADRVRAENPGTLVVGPATAHKDDAFLTALYKAGGLAYLDAVTFHPYDYDYADNKGAEFLVESLKQAEERIREHNNGESKPIWLSEMGWTSTLVRDEQQQADYLVRSETIALASGVERFYWYDLVNDHLDPRDHQGNYGMVRQRTESLPAFEPKAAAAAQAILTRKIGEKAFSERDELDATTYSYAFGEGDDATRVLWSTEPTTAVFAATRPVTVTSQYGTVTVLKPKKGKISIELGEEVVYLDGELRNASVAG